MTNQQIHKQVHRTGQYTIFYCAMTRTNIARTAWTFMLSHSKVRTHIHPHTTNPTHASGDFGKRKESEQQFAVETRIGKKYTKCEIHARLSMLLGPDSVPDWRSVITYYSHNTSLIARWEVGECGPRLTRAEGVRSGKRRLAFGSSDVFRIHKFMRKCLNKGKKLR